MSREESAGLARSVATVFIAFLASCCDRPSTPDKVELESDPSFYGDATMLADGTISIQVAFVHEGSIGERAFTYSTSNPGYEKVRTRVGLEHPGQSVDLLPWPESEDGGQPPDDQELKLERITDATSPR